MRNLLPRRREGGAAAVEFALILPLLAAVLFGTLEYGWILLQKFNLANAVRDGVRQGVTVAQTASPDPRALAVQVARADLTKLGVPSSSVALTATYAGSSPTKTITLSADMTYRKLTGYVPTPSHLTYTMTMMLELQ
ncbi:MAG TPA: TadE/TadG family type IV pilus assembly protein [Polyangia bacterium]|nr:TadE/TadG family type IV pilus assembly protein [Polyangia bacterium]